MQTSRARLLQRIDGHFATLNFPSCLSGHFMHCLSNINVFIWSWGNHGRCAYLCTRICKEGIPAIYTMYVDTYDIHIYADIHTYIHTYINTYLPYLTLPYLTLHYITLHYITLYYITHIHTYYIDYNMIEMPKNYNISKR